LEKRIDGTRFRAGEPSRWQELEGLFGQIHPNSFTTQKKFLLNDLRRRYLLLVTEKPALEKQMATDPAATPEAKPVRPAVKRPAAVIRKPTEN
jgi:hypothetical protein